MSTTRLLVLGVVRMFQPVHGYFVRRELLSWRADAWAAINPGSIYGALKGLTKDAFLEELSGRGDKTRYRLTTDGETEFQALLREALWKVDHYHPGRLMAGMAFLWMIPRDEVLEILDGRAAQLRALASQAARTAGSPGGGPGITVEMFRFSGALVEAELTWITAFADRVRAGEYAFAGEPALEAEHARLAAEHAAEARAARGGG